MGNQAQQSQELELWQVVSQPGNRSVKNRPAKRKRSNMQRRGTVSNYDRSRAGEPRQARAMRAGTPRDADQIRMINTNAPRQSSRSVNMARSGAPRTSGGRAVAVRTNAPRTSNARAQAVRPRYAEPGRQRTSAPRTRAKAQEAKKKVGRRARISQIFAFVWIVAMSAAIVFMGKAFYQSTQKSPVTKVDKTEKTPVEVLPVVEDNEHKPNIREDFLTVSEYNRPGTKLATVKNIFVHYTANPGTSAAQNRSYFESLGQTHERAASAHFIIGYEGEIVQCIPLEEEAYAVVERNGDSISIECCYLEKDGSFTQETYDSLIEMLAWLTDQYDLQPQDILRHYDCGGKKCPLYYVEHEDAWQKLLDDVAHYTL